MDADNELERIWDQWKTVPIPGDIEEHCLIAAAEIGQYLGTLTEVTLKIEGFDPGKAQEIAGRATELILSVAKTALLVGMEEAATGGLLQRRELLYQAIQPIVTFARLLSKKFFGFHLVSPAEASKLPQEAQTLAFVFAESCCIQGRELYDRAKPAPVQPLPTAIPLSLPENSEYAI